MPKYNSILAGTAPRQGSLVYFKQQRITPLRVLFCHHGVENNLIFTRKYVQNITGTPQKKQNWSVSVRFLLFCYGVKRLFGEIRKCIVVKSSKQFSQRPSCFCLNFVFTAVD